MGGGSKQSTSVSVPAWLEDAARATIARANKVSKIGYTPYYGPDVAAMTGPQLASMQGTNQAAMAFGVPTSDFNSGMPQAQDYGGMSAYSSGDLADQAFAELKERRPGQYDAIMARFINPFASGGQTLPGGAPPPAGIPGGNPNAGGGGGNNSGPMVSNPAGGYVSLKDMFDGGGAGTSGATFSGGLLSNQLNNMGIKPIGQGGGGGMGGKK